MLMQGRRENHCRDRFKKMNFVAFLILFCFLLCEGSPVTLNSKFNILKSALEYFRSRSAILIYDGNGKRWEVRDMADFLNVQKLLSFNGFYFSSLTTLPTLSKALADGRLGARETVAVLEFNENFAQFLLKESNETVMSSYKWLLTSASARQSLDNVTVPLDCELIIARRNPHNECELLESYNVDRKRKLTKPLGRWTGGDRFHLNASGDIFTRRKNLEGATVKVISPKKDACLDMSFATGVAAIVWCIHQEVWQVIAEMLNATTEVTVVPNLTPDVIKTADAELTFRSAPLNVVDLNTRSYIWPVFRVKVVLVASYIMQQVEWRTYFLPFSSEMWAGVLVWVIICDLILVIFERISEGKKKRSLFLTYCSEYSFVTAFTVCSQGALGPSKFTGLRIIFVMMFVVPAVLLPGYSAVLTSFLTVQLNKKPFQSLEELSQIKEYKMGWHNTFALQHMFNLEDKSPLNQALLMNNVLPEDELPATDAEGVERMCKEKFVFVTIMDTILALKPKCSYYTLKQHFKVVFTSMEIKKNSWYKHLLDRCERKLDFTGALYRLELHAIMKHIKYDEKNIVEVGDYPPIKLDNIILPFAVLLLGAVSSAFLLALEIACFKADGRQQMASKNTEVNRL